MDKRRLKAAINALLLLFLLLSCTLPRLWLNRVCKELSGQALLASAAEV